MGLLDWFRRRPKAFDAAIVPAIPPKEDYRFLVLMEQPVIADLINQATPFLADHATTSGEGLAALRRTCYSAVVALSPMNEQGSAVQLIRAFREANPKGLAIYHGWDYRIELSGVPAEGCDADFLLVGAVLGEEVVGFFPAAVELHRRGILPRPSLQWYEQSLQRCFPRSPFWTLAEQFRAAGVPPSEYE